MDTANQYVKLNVGGALFHTTLGTLLKYDSMFKAMFSGRNEVFRDSDGYVPIDRCGKHFGLILNFMRDGTVPLPDCRTEVQEIIIEAKFYLIQELVSLCESWFINMEKAQVEPIGVCQVPVVMSKKQVERIWQSSTGRPVIELLLNRNNNKYSYNTSSDENFLRNQELFDKLLLRFNSSKNNNVLFIKNLGIGSPEICQWTFYGNASRKVEISCTSIVYTPEKKQTKVEFPEARIYEETLNALLTFGGCTHCKNDDPSIQQKPSSTESARRGLVSIFYYFSPTSL
ncbi:unnamed protein product [Meloidogyne enterolobii]|uniref:Uncharacterized protein n=1 Tax=Meloidogyne enterolobii TaxID=390850 RepID=A0ACB1ALI2_MELEN